MCDPAMPEAHDAAAERTVAAEEIRSMEGKTTEAASDDEA
jgi:hypothetical protein